MQIHSSWGRHNPNPSTGIVSWDAMHLKKGLAPSRGRQKLTKSIQTSSQCSPDENTAPYKACFFPFFSCWSIEKSWNRLLMAAIYWQIPTVWVLKSCACELKQKRRNNQHPSQHRDTYCLLATTAFLNRGWSLSGDASLPCLVLQSWVQPENQNTDAQRNRTERGK